LDFARLEFA